MKVSDNYFRTIWLAKHDNTIVQIIDQRFLPYEIVIEDIKTADEMAAAIKDMHVRGAGLIGVAAAYGIYLAVLNAQKQKNPEKYIEESAEKLISTRPTAINLKLAVQRQLSEIRKTNNFEEKMKIALKIANKIANEDIEYCKKIGQNGLKIIEEVSKRKKGKNVNVLTHCNAGWLAFVDYGSALSPVYAAFDKGIKIHVFVDETRPRNQGSRLTAWELEQYGVPCTIIADNTGGYLMQKGEIDLVIVGADRVTKKGDVVNKIGTYLKALAAHDNKIPFYVAFPSTTFDSNAKKTSEIPIEKRGSEEVKYIEGFDEKEKKIKKLLLAPKKSNVLNYGFDITPAKYITGLITERGVCKADEKEIKKLFGNFF